MNLPFNLGTTLQGLSKVNLRGGVVGKVTIAVIAVCLAITLVAWSVHNVWLSASALVAIFVLAFTMLWRLINFADRHPQAALFEGAEFLAHEQILNGTKEHPILFIDPMDRMQPETIQGEAANPQLALEPDTETSSLDPGNEKGRA